MIITWFPCPSFLQTQIQNDRWLKRCQIHPTWCERKTWCIFRMKTSFLKFLRKGSTLILLNVGPVWGLNPRPLGQSVVLSELTRPQVVACLDMQHPWSSWNKLSRQKYRSPENIASSRLVAPGSPRIDTQELNWNLEAMWQKWLAPPSVKIVISFFRGDPFLLPTNSCPG